MEQKCSCVHQHPVAHILPCDTCTICRSHHSDQQRDFTLDPACSKAVCTWPVGGRLQLHVHSDGLVKGADIFPDLNITMSAQDLHAPLCERLLELPVDITAGKACQLWLRLHMSVGRNGCISPYQSTKKTKVLSGTFCCCFSFSFTVEEIVSPGR